MDSSDLTRLKHQIEQQREAARRLMHQWGVLIEPTLWQGTAYYAARGQWRSGSDRVHALHRALDHAAHECDQRIREAEREEEASRQVAAPW